MRILLVEDEADLARPLLELLRRERHEVVWVDAYAPALAALRRPFDLVVLDVMLPDADDAGFRLAEALRRRGFGGGILFLTALDAAADRLRALELGGDYLLKPFSLREFLARVRALARRHAPPRIAEDA
jgi:DNA-binding response OmpR family regulator